MNRQHFALILRSLLITVIVVAIGGYAALELRPYFSGSSLTITAPENGSAFVEPFITIEGSAPGARNLTLNGAKLLPDSEGNFVSALLLLPGYNTYHIEATDRFNRTLSERLELLYTPPEEFKEKIDVELLGTTTNDLITNSS